MKNKILVVDDDDGILDALQTMLSVYYQVETSLSGEILKKLDKENFPDLILLDVLLSGEDGRQLCQSLKSNQDTKNIPIVMISANTDVKNGVKSCGADDFLFKPFGMNDLLNKIKNHLK